MNEELKRIIGGIEVKNDSVIIGGAEIIVGENVRWMVRNKLLMFENETKHDINIRRLIKIIGLKLPIETSDIKYYNNEQLPTTTVQDKKSIIKGKILTILRQRLSVDVNDIIEKLIVEYELRDPFYIAIYSIIKCLAYINKTNNPSSYRIKINAALASRLLHKESYYFAFSTKANINNVKELFMHMLSLVENNDKTDKKFKCPVLKHKKYPVFDKEEYEKKSKNEAERLVNNNSVKDHVFAILMMENMLTDYLDKVERYYIAYAKNMALVLDTLYSYFKIEINV